MHKMTNFLLRNADCYGIDLECDKKILFDFADTRDPKDENDLRCDLSNELREHLEACNRDYFDVVAFSHPDKNLFSGATDFFYLEHTKIPGRRTDKNEYHVGPCCPHYRASS